MKKRSGSHSVKKCSKPARSAPLCVRQIVLFPGWQIFPDKCTLVGVFGVVLALFFALPLALPEQKTPATSGSQVQEPPSSFFHRGTRRNPFLPPFTLGHTEAPKLRLPVSDESGGLRLMGILRSPSGLNKAILNDRTLVEGQSGQFTLDGRLVDVKLLRVDASEVTVQLDGEKTLIIKLQEPGASAPADHSKEKP